jgi:replicative DNA helicase
MSKQEEDDDFDEIFLPSTPENFQAQYLGQAVDTTQQDTISEVEIENGLPARPSIERAIIGAIILDNSLADQAADFLRPEDFYLPSCREMFVAQMELRNEGSHIDQLTMAHRLEQHGILNSVGGVYGITQTMAGLPHFADISVWAKTVRDASKLRQLIKENRRATSEALEWELEAQEIVDRHEESLYIINSGNENPEEGFTDVGVGVAQSLDHIAQVAEMGTAITGVPSGYSDLDEMTHGFQNGNLIIIAGRPSMGKTTLALNIGHNACIDYDRSVAIFSLEMSKEEVFGKILCCEARVDHHRYLGGFLNNEEHEKLVAAQDRLNHLRLYIDDTPGVDLPYIKRRTRRLASRLDKEDKKLDLIIVDYLQLMSGNQRRGESREQEVSSISRGLKGLAKSFHVPLIALSQLNRDPENRSDHRPMLSDLRESGSIEQDADVVVFVYRDEVYNKDTTDKGIAEIIVRKQRIGPVDTVKLAFLMEISRFEMLWGEM